MDTQTKDEMFDKVLLASIWVIALVATVTVSYWPPPSETQAVLLQTMLTLVTSVLSALLVLINHAPQKPDQENKPDV